MPNRIIRESILSSERKPSRWIPVALRRKLQAMPCAICGIPFDIHCDHIIPVSKGGASVTENLQPLCSDCNYTKKHLRSNEETRLVIKSRGLDHFINAAYRYGTRGCNQYDKPLLQSWAATNPEEIQRAKRLFNAFCKGSNS